ncbi:MAG: hypothetical protein E6K70_08175, partial [Planctomycetota bacterium]
MDRPVHSAKGAGWNHRPPFVLCLLLVGFWLSASGCTRPFFRKQADKEVDAVLAEKDRYQTWRIDQYHVYPDPRARFADPTNPDCPPMPPDDPAAWELSPHPQKPREVAIVGSTGYLDLLAGWDVQNRAAAAADKKSAPESPDAKPVEKLPVLPRELLNGEGKQKPGQPGNGKPGVPKQEPGNELARPDKASNGKNDGQERKGYASGPAAASTTSLSTTAKPGAPRAYLINLEQAAELGLINSREFQDRREDLYLTALPVTLERFSFAAQFFTVGQAIREWAGREAPEGHLNDWRLNGNVGFSKLFSTGALLLVNFANQTVFNLAGTGRGTISQSTINLDLVQPLLRGGGRAVTLEPLTQTERNLVYEIRSYARFRKEFFVAIAGGGGGSITGAAFQPTGVIAPSNFSPGAGIGASGLIPGVISSVPITANSGLQVNPGSSGRSTLQTAFAAPVSGYLTTLLEAAQMQVDEYNIAKLEEFLALAGAVQEGGDISQLQVDQFEQQLLAGRSSLLTDQLQYLTSLDQFKLQLGLPTELPIELDDAQFRPLTRQFQRYEDLFKEFDVATIDEPARLSGPDQVANVRQGLRRIFTSSPLVRGTRFGAQIQADWNAWEKLTNDAIQKRLADYAEERRRLLGRKTDAETKGQTLSAAELQRIDRLSFEIDLGAFELVLRDYESQPWKNVLDPDLRRRQQQARFRYVLNAFILALAPARNERILKLRGQWPDLARLCVNGVDLLKADLDDAQAAVIQTALMNRLDLMNARALAVDAWRQLAVFANALLGTFNVQYHMDASTPAGLAQPLNFSGSRSH